MKVILRIFVAMSLIGTPSVLAQGASQPSGSSSVATSVGTTAGYYRRNVGPSSYGDVLGLFRSGGSSAFVVPAGETSVEELLAANEDMTVMTRIFSRALGQANLAGHARNPFVSFLGQNGQPAPSVYLDGYGALFTLSVDFPLVPPSKDEQPAPQEEQAETDPLWEEMRADIFDPAPSQRRPELFAEGVPEYSAQKVESLKATLIATLKHAANIRALGPDEVVVVTVVGATLPGQLHSIRSVPGSNEYEFTGGQGRTRITADHLADAARAAPTVLMIRATASAISAFAKGQSALEEFRDQVSVVEYPHLGQMVESGPTIPGARRRSQR
ncbi:MAG: hypothetical protein JSW27_14310 [Phycisphaerales bacterium]|nr:MAG: hypothetical protein JSW27_14310 [Phycisphaerales bacterium]